MRRSYKKDILSLFKNIKLLILDVDGVLTKGEIIYDDQGRELKIFNVKDGLGIFILRELGIKTILLTARNSNVLKKRAEDMKVAEVIGGILPKERVLDDILRRYKVKKDEICFVGDDIIDCGMVEKVGVGVAVADAHKSLKKKADYISSHRGGEGAVREIVDLIIEAKNLKRETISLFR